MEKEISEEITALEKAAAIEKNEEEKLGGSKRAKTLILIAVAMISFLAIGGLVFFLYSIVMKASTMRLSDYYGDVTLTVESGRIQELKQDLRIFGGSELKTGKESKAWVLLDEERIVTVMEKSTVHFYQSGKSISISLEKGDLFFNVAREIDEDESFEISTSTMIVGIRGTSGYVRESENGYPVIYLTSGKVIVGVEDPNSGNTDQRKIRAGQKLTVMIIDGEIEMIIEDIREADLPEEALFEIFSDADLYDEVLEETDWDKETLEYLYDSYKNGINDDEADSNSGGAVGKAEEVVGTWRLDKELSDTVNTVEKYLYFNNDLTGRAYFLFNDSADEFEFEWNYIESTGLVAIDCENNIHDAAMFYEDGNLIWLSNVFYKVNSDPASADVEQTYDIVGNWIPESGEDTKVYCFRFEDDNSGVVTTLVGETYIDIKVNWNWTATQDVYVCWIVPGQYLTDLGSSQFYVSLQSDKIFYDDCIFVRS